MLVDLGQISLDVSYIDGTKLESVANKYTFVWQKSIEKTKQNWVIKFCRNIVNEQRMCLLTHPLSLSIINS